VSPWRTSPPTIAPVPPPLLPALRQDARVTLPGGERCSARVIELAEGEITLVLMLAVRNPLARGTVAEMALEFAAPRGIVRLEGHGELVARDLLRFRLEGAGNVLQRRDYVRVDVVRPMAVALVDDEGEAGEWIDTLTANVSGNGVLAAGPDTLAVGDTVLLRLALVEHEEPIEGDGRVVRIADDGRRAIAIEQLHADGRRRLVRFIFDCERIARQRTRDTER
jgi:PilZ domain